VALVPEGGVNPTGTTESLGTTNALAAFAAHGAADPRVVCTPVARPFDYGGRRRHGSKASL
jgi:hypothetical protein